MECDGSSVLLLVNLQVQKLKEYAQKYVYNTGCTSGLMKSKVRSANKLLLPQTFTMF